MSQSILVHIPITFCNVSQKKKSVSGPYSASKGCPSRGPVGYSGVHEGPVRPEIGPCTWLAHPPPYCYIVPSLFATRLVLQTHCGCIFPPPNTSFSRSMWVVPKPFLIYVRTIFSDISKISFQFNWFNLHVIALAQRGNLKKKLFSLLGNIYKQTS